MSQFKIEKTDGQILFGVLTNDDGSQTRKQLKVLGHELDTIIMEDETGNRVTMKVVYTSCPNVMKIDKMTGGETPEPAPQRYIRFKFSNTSTDPLNTPTMQSDDYTWEAVDQENGIWDAIVTKEGDDWSGLFSNKMTQYVITGTVDVLGGETSGVTNMTTLFSGDQVKDVALFDTSSVKKMSNMFGNCSKLASVPLFDTSSVEYMDGMFYQCFGLAEVPLFDTSKVITMSEMFYGNMSTFGPQMSLKSVPLFDTSNLKNATRMFNHCRSVESGALDLYTQMSTQETPPQYFSDCFTNCGSNTETGTAELAQIPASWGGTMA